MSWLAGETLICCGPVGWGILIAGAATGATFAYLGSEGGKWAIEKAWDNWIEPNIDEIEDFLATVGRIEILKAKGGYY